MTTNEKYFRVPELEIFKKKIAGDIEFHNHATFKGPSRFEHISTFAPKVGNKAPEGPGEIQIRSDIINEQGRDFVVPNINIGLNYNVGGEMDQWRIYKEQWNQSDKKRHLIFKSRGGISSQGENSANDNRRYALLTHHNHTIT